MNTPKTLKEELRPYWKFWNVGRDPYWRRHRISETVRTIPWHQTAHDAAIDELRSTISSSRGGRWTPEGLYVKLEILQRGVHYNFDGQEVWEIVMSDTPDEMNDTADAILHAEGRVLVHGLGLGCVLNCILRNPKVTHVDVVEANADVIKVVGPFFKNYVDLGFLTIHHDSCVEKKWPKGTRWNYVWHDIWTTISDRNLTDDSEAEHGISYARLHRMFGGRCDRQESWAFKMARQMREVGKFQDMMAENWTQAWNYSDPEERLEMLVVATCPALAPLDAWKQMVLDEKVRDFLGSESIYERYRERAQSEMSVGEANVLLEDVSRRIGQEKVGMMK